MLTHAFSCLQGPVTRSRLWWYATDLDTPNVLNDPETLCTENPRETESPEEAPIRWQLVERVRREIAAGAYETPHKWEIALDRLLQRVAGV
jgi:hypothetical protein